MRKVLSVLLAVLMLAATMAFAAVPASALDPSGREGNINWTYSPSTKTLTISGDGSMDSYYANIPAWDQYNTAVESIVIELGVTSIGDYAFTNFYVLKTVTISDSVTTIEKCAFAGCSSLETLYVSDSVTKIKEAAFYECTALSDIYYAGTQTQWNNISINYNYNYNVPIDNAVLHTNYGYVVSASASPAAGGTVSAEARYLPNTKATVVATSNAGYAFEGWYSGSTRVSNTPEYTFTVTWNKDLTAKFVTSGATTYSVSVSAGSGGSVSGAGSYSYGSFATVRATPNSGYTFDGWYEGSTKVSSSAEYRFTVSRDISLTAKFTYTGTSGTYTVTVSAGPGGTASGGGTYSYNEFATVKATPNSGYAFDGWYEGSKKVGTTLTWHFQVSRSISLTAKFTYTGTTTYTVSVAAGTGGTVFGGGTFAYGEFATVVATPNSGYTFAGWYEGSAKVSSAESYRFSVSRDISLTAKFTYTGTSTTYTVTVSAGTGGTVSGGGTFAYGMLCTVTAASNSGYAFDGWYSGSTKLSTAQEYTFTVTSNVSLTAKFIKSGAKTYTVKVIAEPGGTVSGGGTFTYGEFATVTAEAKDGYEFAGWYDGDKKISGQESYRFAVGNDYTLTAKFVATNLCHWCGKVHEGFIQKIIGFFHSILAAILGARY